MVAPSNYNSIHCFVIQVPVEPYSGRLSDTRRRREMLPWADPYIAGLVQRLKLEIESERAERRMPSGSFVDRHTQAEASPPLHSGDLDFEQPDRDSWPLPDEIF